MSSLLPYALGLFAFAVGFYLFFGPILAIISVVMNDSVKKFKKITWILFVVFIYPIGHICYGLFGPKRNILNLMTKFFFLAGLLGGITLVFTEMEYKAHYPLEMDKHLERLSIAEGEAEDLKKIGTDINLLKGEMASISSINLVQFGVYMEMNRMAGEVLRDKKLEKHEIREWNRIFLNRTKYGIQDLEKLRKSTFQNTDRPIPIRQEDISNGPSI